MDTRNGRDSVEFVMRYGRHAVLSSHNTSYASAPQSLPKTRAKFLSQPPGVAVIPGSGPPPQLLSFPAEQLP
jgi:hypothetical protein